MKFLQKLITEHANLQMVAEQEEVVSVDAAGTNIGEYLLYVKHFIVEGKEMRNFSHNHGISYTTMGGTITEIMVGVHHTGTKKTFYAEVYPQQPIDTSDIDTSAIASAEIMVMQSPDGGRLANVKPEDGAELEEYLTQLVRGYLIKNLANVVEETFNTEFDTQDPDNRRQMMSNRDPLDFD